jgi:hypothetical protein
MEEIMGFCVSVFGNDLHFSDCVVDCGTSKENDAGIFIEECGVKV